MKDVTFFRKDKLGRLQQLPRNAEPALIMSADAATLKLDNQKNGWKGVCVSHHSNGLEAFDPVRALGRRYLHIREWSSEGENTLLSAYFGSNGVRGDLRDRDVRTALKLAYYVC